MMMTPRRDRDRLAHQPANHNACVQPDDSSLFGIGAVVMRRVRRQHGRSAQLRCAAVFTAEPSG